MRHDGRDVKLSRVTQQAKGQGQQAAHGQLQQRSGDVGVCMAHSRSTSNRAAVAHVCGGRGGCDAHMLVQATTSRQTKAGAGGYVCCLPPSVNSSRVAQTAGVMLMASWHACQNKRRAVPHPAHQVPGPQQHMVWGHMAKVPLSIRHQALCRK